MTLRVRADASRSVPGVGGQVRLPPAVVLEPAQVVGELTRRRNGGRLVPCSQFRVSSSLRFKFGSSPRARTVGDQEPYDRNADLPPVRRASRSTANASSGTQVGLPVKSSVIACAVPIESWTPARKWPVATNTLSQPGTGPMNGSPSGVPGRKPAPAPLDFGGREAGTIRVAKARRSATASRSVRLLEPSLRFLGRADQNAAVEARDEILLAEHQHAGERPGRASSAARSVRGRGERRRQYRSGELRSVLLHGSGGDQDAAGIGTSADCAAQSPRRSLVGCEPIGPIANSAAAGHRLARTRRSGPAGATGCEPGRSPARGTASAGASSTAGSQARKRRRATASRMRSLRSPRVRAPHRSSSGRGTRSRRNAGSRCRCR